MPAWPTRMRNALMALSLLVAAAGVRAEEAYTFAVVPQYEQRKLHSIWKPIVDDVARRSGVPLRLVATLGVPDFERELSKGSFDFAYANPYHILLESRRQGYIPLVRDSHSLTGVLLVARDGPIRSIADLDGKTLAVPSPNALGASLLLRSDLEQIHHVHVRMLDVKTHTSVYLNVARGMADAGGGVQKTLAEQDERLQGALRVLYSTRAMPSHPVAAHPRVPRAVREAVRQALLDLAATPAGQELLADVPLLRMVPASIDDYLVMRDWGLEKYWVEEPRP